LSHYKPRTLAMGVGIRVTHRADISDIKSVLCY
jgi:hypothetical protein